MKGAARRDRRCRCGYAGNRRSILQSNCARVKCRNKNNRQSGQNCEAARERARSSRRCMGREASQQHAARDFGDGARRLLPAAQRTHAGTHERSFRHRHWPVLLRVAAVDHAAAGQALCSAAEPRPRRRASITGITTRNGFCRSCLAPLHKSLSCYLLPERFAELLSALVAKITMTFWPNAVAVPKVHPREA